MAKITRRRFLKHLAVLSGTAVLTAGYTGWVEPYWVQVVKRPLPIKNLPQSLQGKKIMQISDIHAGDYFSREYLIKELKNAAQLDPDIIVYTGDFVSYESPEQYEHLREVIRHAPLGKMGTFGVLGNHDYGPDWDDQQVGDNVVEIVSENGIQILRNEVVRVDGLKLGGIDDFWGPQFEPELATRQFNHEDAAIILCHNPDVADLPVWGDFKGWILSGHTHGGQIRPPFIKAPIVPVKNRDYTAGEYTLENGRFLYINRALGHYIPVRFNVRPEITLFNLQQA